MRRNPLNDKIQELAAYKIRELAANATNNLFAEIQRRKAAGNPMSLEEIQQLQRSQVHADAQAVLEALKKSLKRKP